MTLLQWERRAASSFSFVDQIADAVVAQYVSLNHFRNKLEIFVYLWT
jgi:hypothetical protein